MLLSYIVLVILIGVVSSHHHDEMEISEPWHFHQHGIFRAFFGGFFSTLLLILGVLVFYYYCVRGSSWGRVFPIFPRKPIIPITVPFARATNYMDSDHPETIVLTATSPPTVFYSNSPTFDHTASPPVITKTWNNAGSNTQSGHGHLYPGYNVL
ncbi:hypothetical protein Ocin01_06564 [Orchesella cincta]|uniref:Uncharacterized protein n=1 Tax=Orchesella cincta TaxID=48709 RepID=A0A1D2N4A1_ORCCI|nr:hypothetical protein Ocin01_06564 [Orchesella cincta]